MQLRRNRVLWGVLFVLITLAVSYKLRRTWEGARGFYLWKQISGKAHQGRYVTSDGAQIYFETFGSGEPVLVLHGGGPGCLEAMHRQIRALADKYFVIAPDSRAHGRSGDGSGPLTYVQLTRDMIKVLDELNVPAANIVGWSDGGIVGLELAMHYPQRVRRLVAIGANYNVDGLIQKPEESPEVWPLDGACARVIPDPSLWPSRVRRVVQMWRTQPNYSLADLGTIKVPTLIMAGEFDAIRRSHTDQLAKAIPDSHEEIIEGGGHSVDYKSGVINTNIINFLASPLPADTGSRQTTGR
jgi:pimeloyl-ACP methyl ester carboxylesterase